MKIAWGIKDFSQLSNVVDYGWGMAESDKAFVFVDNHDTQRGGHVAIETLGSDQTDRFRSASFYATSANRRCNRDTGAERLIIVVLCRVSENNHLFLCLKIAPLLR